MGKIKPYVKTDWVPGVTPVTRENMTNIEEQVESITNVLVEASSTDKSAGAIVVRNSEGKVEGDIAGNSGTTTKFDKKKLLKVTGVVNGQVQFDGSEEGDKIEIATTLDKGYQQLLDQKLECFLNTKHMQGCPTLGLGQYCYVINDIVVDGSRLYEVIDYAGEVKLDNGLWARLVPRKTITGDLSDLMFALTEKILEGLNQLEGVVLAIKTEKNSALTAINSDKVTALNDIALARGTALGTLEQYMHAAENGGNANSVQGYVPRNFKRTEDTIADLVSSASNKYRIGDIVELNGYYTAGDGAGHPRQKKPVGYNGADAVIGADGSIWGIVHNGEVNVSCFGNAFYPNFATKTNIDIDVNITTPVMIKSFKRLNSYNSEFGSIGTTSHQKIKLIKTTKNTVDIPTHDSNYPVRQNVETMLYTNTDFEQGVYPQGFSFSNLNFIGDGSGNGITVSYGGQFIIEKCFFSNLDNAIKIYDGWSFTIDKVITQNNSLIDINGGTSAKINECHLQGGLKMTNMFYSKLDTVTSDHCTRDVFEFDNVKLDMSSCGCEAYGDNRAILVKNNCNINITNFNMVNGTSTAVPSLEVSGNNNYVNIIGWNRINSVTDKIKVSGVGNRIHINSNIRPSIDLTGSNNIVIFENAELVEEHYLIGGQHYSKLFYKNTNSPINNNIKYKNREDVFRINVLSQILLNNTVNNVVHLAMTSKDNASATKTLEFSLTYPSAQDLIIPVEFVGGFDSSVANNFFLVVVAGTAEATLWIRNQSGIIAPMTSGYLNTFEIKCNFSYPMYGFPTANQMNELAILRTEMEDSGVYDDFIHYTESKIKYDNYQNEKTNSGIMTLQISEEPTPSENLIYFKNERLQQGGV